MYDVRCRHELGGVVMLHVIMPGGRLVTTFIPNRTLTAVSDRKSKMWYSTREKQQSLAIRQEDRWVDSRDFRAHTRKRYFAGSSLTAL